MATSAVATAADDDLHGQRSNADQIRVFLAVRVQRTILGGLSVYGDLDPFNGMQCDDSIFEMEGTAMGIWESGQADIASLGASK